MAKRYSWANLGKIAAALGGAGAIIPVVKPLVEIISKEVADAVHERKAYVDIPPLYGKELSLEVEQAKAALEAVGLRAELVPVRQASAAYKDCFDLQVVCSTPRHKRKVKPGTLIFLQYVTTEVIEESKSIFEESEKQKLEKKEARERKRLERKDKNRPARSDAAIATKKVPQIFSRRRHNKNDSPDA